MVSNRSSVFSTARASSRCPLNGIARFLHLHHGVGATRHPQDAGLARKLAVGRLKRMADRAPAAFKACNLGAHESYDGDLEGLVYDTGKLAAAVLKGVK